MVLRHTVNKRMRAKLQEVKQTLRLHMHSPLPEQGAWLRSVVRGYYAYHAVPTNMGALEAFRTQVTCYWLRTLRRRSQKSRITWERMNQIATRWLPRPRILHPWPRQRRGLTPGLKVRARCGSAARRDPRGGRADPHELRPVPTATLLRFATSPFTFRRMRVAAGERGSRR
jgi:hypothetical protein